jgi:hypothetical protein
MRLLVLAMSLILCAPAHAKSFCGTFDILAMKTPEIQKYLEESSLAVMAGPKAIQCGLPGESYAVCRQCIDRLKPADWNKARDFLASYEHRNWHFRWHRDFDKAPLPSNAEFLRIQKRMLTLDREDPAAFSARMKANAGESFFFMHRTMIKMLQVELTAEGLPCIAGWEKPPTDAFDKAWPVPAALAGPQDDDEKEIYDRQMQNIKDYVKKFDNPALLKTLTLSQLGTQVQFSIHIMLHTQYEITDKENEENCQGDIMHSPTCNNLGNDASSHVNVHFWKLHGYVDSLIGKWLKVNGYSEIAVKCDGRPGCYQWKGTYLGETYSNLAGIRD